MTGFENFILVFGMLFLSIMYGINTPDKNKPVKQRPIPRSATVKHRELIPKRVAIPMISSNKKDAISGLRSLGFDKDTATQRISKMPDGMPLEEMIKRGLSI